MIELTRSTDDMAADAEVLAAANKSEQTSTRLDETRQRDKKQLCRSYDLRISGIEDGMEPKLD